MPLQYSDAAVVMQYIKFVCLVVVNVLKLLVVHVNVNLMILLKKTFLYLIQSICIAQLNLCTIHCYIVPK